MALETWLLFLVIGAAAGIFIFHTLKKHQEIKTGRKTAKDLNPEDFPLGIALFTPEGNTIWFNSHFSFLTDGKATPGKKAGDILPGLDLSRLQGTKTYADVLHYARKTVYIKMTGIIYQERLRYLLLCEELTAQIRTLRSKSGNRPVIALVMFDNLTESLRAMSEEEKPHLLGALEKTLSEWASALDGYLRRVSDSRYIVIFNEWGYRQLEKTRFAILDKVREVEPLAQIPLTVSIGIGISEDSLSELGRLAEEALEVAQERGGDQVVIKSPEKTRFFGGKSIGIEKRTKVKARVTAEALKELILLSSQVIVMGHEMADYDSMGAALGLAKAVSGLGKKCWVVIEKNNPNTERLFGALADGSVAARLVKAEEAARKVTANTLLIIVDTHKTSLVAEPGLLRLVSRIAVIDHHRRGEDFIEDASLVYLQSYASSASELVTELLQYLGEQAEPGRAEATALLAGITVDTKNFIMQTGVRTFEAASYLRSLGADPAVVQSLLSEDISIVVKKAGTLSRARVLYGKVALGVSPDKSHDAQQMAAKTADAMLNIAGVKVSFVIWPSDEGVAVSARSNGEINVQTIMEKMGGGGHFTIAAAQVETSPEEAENRLLQILEEEFRQ